MHENNFEKQVREKMEQLGFDPADAVWANVDKEINREKKRRSPVFWLFFLTGIMIASGSYFILIKKEAGTRTVASKPTEIINDHGSAGETRPAASALSAEGVKTDNITAPHLKPSLIGVLNKRIVVKSISVLTDKKTKNVEGTTGFSKKVAYGSEKYASTDQQKDKITEDVKESPHRNEIAEADSQNNQRNMFNDKPDSAESSSHDQQRSVVEYKSFRKDSLSETSSAKNKNKDKGLSSWKIGFTGEAGISDINQTLFKSGSLVIPAYNALSNNGGSNPGSGDSASNITTGFSFGAGFFVIRNLSDRISISAGLNYHYYSTKIHVGSHEDNSITVNSIPGQLIQARSFYENGRNHNYTNQYHFIELPVLLEYELNTSSRMPFIWEGGFSVAWLLGSDALHYDPLTNTYYQFNKLFNKAQINAVAAIMIGLLLHHYTLQLGPQLEYGLTNLLKTSAGTPQHVFYLGLKISFIRGIK